MHLSILDFTLFISTYDIQSYQGGFLVNELYYNAGARIKQLRILNHMSREKLAEKAEITSQFLYDIEMGHKGFSADTLYRISTALSVSTDFILTGLTTYETNKVLQEVLALFHPEQIGLLAKLLEATYQLCNSPQK